MLTQKYRVFNEYIFIGIIIDFIIIINGIICKEVRQPHTSNLKC